MLEWGRREGRGGGGGGGGGGVDSFLAESDLKCGVESFSTERELKCGPPRASSHGAQRYEHARAGTLQLECIGHNC